MDNFINRRRMAWISFTSLLLVLTACVLGITITNESIVNTILICFTSIVLGYFTGASYEKVKEQKKDGHG